MSAFFQQFPFLVWEKIVEKLEDPKDKLNLLQTDLDLENSFHYKKAEWQFAAILPIFLASYNFSEEEKDRPVKNAVIACRLLSSLCCKTIDKYIESHWDDKYVTPSFFHRDSAHLYFCAVISSFLEQMGNHPEHRPLIVCRNVYVHVPPLTFNIDEEDIQDFGTKYERAKLQLQMLDKVGARLKGLDLLFQVNISHPVCMMMYIQEALWETPNLRTLKINVVAGDDPFHNLDISTLRMPPTPPLPQLKCLNILYLMQTVPLVLQLMNLQIYFPGLVVIRMPTSLWKEEYNTNSKELFPNLKSLSLLSAYAGTSKNVKEKVWRLLEHLEAPKLEEMDIALAWFIRDGNPADVNSLKEFGISCLEKRCPRAIWNCEVDKWFSSMRFFNAGEKQEEGKVENEKEQKGGDNSDEKCGNDENGKGSAENSQTESSDVSRSSN